MVARELAGALVSPVVTAHPTEVRRKTISAVQQQITELVRERDRTAPASSTSGVVGPALAGVLTLWQTALLRLSRLRLSDEIDEALRYYELSLFEVVPALNAELARRCAALARGALLERPVLRPGSWIGGDRDGNPFVTADTLRRRRAGRPTIALAHHLARSRLARRAVDVDRLVTPTRSCSRSPSASGDDSPFRDDEPYRRALGGIYARLCATALEVLGAVPARRRGRAAALRDARRAAAPTSTWSTRRCAATARARSPTTGWRRLRGAVERLRLPPLRAGPAAELRRPRGGRRRAAGLGRGRRRTTRALDEEARVELLRRRAATRRPLVAPGRRASETAAASSTCCVAAAARGRVLGPRAVPNYVISMCESVSDLLEVAVLLKEVGLLRPGADAADCGRHRPAVRDDRRPHRAATTLAALLADPLYRDAGRRAAATCRK